MGKLIAVVGNVGVGKTTFVQRFCAATGYMPALEAHAERPFQAEFAANPQHGALANQIDYLLVRAEQEQAIRRLNGVGVNDGGLDQDVFFFTRYFAHTGYLQPREYDLCQRFFHFTRSTLPPPDLFIYLTAPVEMLIDRYARRSRAFEVITPADIPLLESFVREWMESITAAPVITVDAATDDPSFSTQIATLLASFPGLLAQVQSTSNDS